MTDSASVVERGYPFTAIVGQPKLSRALTMLAVNPRLCGVLIRGDKGTAKSTAARALARLLPAVGVNRGCPYGCPSGRPDVWCDQCRTGPAHETEERRPSFETLPLGTTDDQLIGTLDLEAVLRDGTQRFSPGLLARVNQGVVYVDEVNLLEDHLVDLLLDVATTGVNLVAREGVRFRHPAEFVLIGTMNPEEGALRPQLRDRFGLCVEIETLSDPDARAEVVERRLRFDDDPETFVAEWQEEEDRLAENIVRARALLPSVSVPREWCLAAAHLALSVGVDGHRADVLLARGAATLAALDGRTAIQTDDLARAAGVVLPHRLARRPFESATGLSDDEVAKRAAQATVDAGIADEEPPGKRRPNRAG